MRSLALLALLVVSCANQTDPVTGEGYYSPIGNDYQSQLKYIKSQYLNQITTVQDGGDLNEPEIAAACEEVFIDNLKVAAEVANAKGVKLNLEPLNLRDVPGYLHTDTAHTRRIIEAVGSGNLFLQYDLYHMQIMEGDLAEGLRRNWDLISHIQFSSVPGRHEPQYGEVNIPHMFEVIDGLGYTGWVGCEYAPKGDTLDGLSWAEPYGLGPR